MVRRQEICALGGWEGGRFGERAVLARIRGVAMARWTRSRHAAWGNWTPNRLSTLPCLGAGSRVDEPELCAAQPGRWWCPKTVSGIGP